MGFLFPGRRAVDAPCHLLLGVIALFGSAAVALEAQDLTPGIPYVCSGERVFIENCNMRDLSDTATCMVGHPDHVQPNGLMQYTTVTRGALKKLFPACTQPTAKQTAAAHAVQERQQQLYNANVQKANDQLNAAQAQPASLGAPQKPKTADERAMNRCITSGRLPSSCMGNSLLGAFGQMLSSVLPAAGPSGPSAGPTMAGVFQGAGNWRLDFIDGGVLVNCAFLSPNQESYQLDFRNDRTVLVIDTKPKPLVLTVKPDGTITGPGPLTIDGVVAGGSSGGTSSPGHYETSQVTTHESVTALDAQTHATDPNLVNDGGSYSLAHTSTQSTYVPGAYTPAQTSFAPRRATCPALNLSSKGAGTGIQTMQTDLLKSMMGGDKGPPTPPGIRMHGIFAASTGFSVQFFPESAVLGCGPDAARAYPYTVVAEGSRALVKIDAADHPLTLAYKADGSLDPAGSGPYQVHGRVVTGQSDNDDFTFAPMERSCNLAVLTPSKTIPDGGGSAATMVASSGSAASPAPTGRLATPQAPLGNATLSIVSGLPTSPGAANPLAGHPYVLLRDSYADALAKGGVTVPPGVSPYKFVATTCASRTPDCQKIIAAINNDAASAARADATGKGTLPGVAPGSYHLMISARFNNQALMWGQAVQLQPGANAITLDQRNATPVN